MLDDVGRSLSEGFFMFWETLWPLVLGFGLAGIVQAFVSRGAIQARLGSHRPAALARATGYGMASSSCSYAASAMAKSLFAKGADFLSSMVFMIASTNLVIELGIVLIILIGWQFAAAELVGGLVMIVLLAALGGILLSGRHVASARQSLASNGADAGDDAEHAPSQRQGRSRVASKGAWDDAASYMMADLKMLRRELLVGYLVAGFLATIVPVHLWHAVFLRGHGDWTLLENVAVAPLVAMVSFVCSIGNVPLAAALWKGGIAFGGVVAFIFADLVSFPLLLIYRRYYGTRLMLRMLAVFWVVMSLAGLITDLIFGAAGLIPRSRPGTIAPAHFSWGYTSYLNIAFIALFAVAYWAYRSRKRQGGGRGYAFDPVCGMQVRIADAPASVVRAGGRLYFCSDHCRERFEAAPSRFEPAGSKATSP